MGSPSRQKGLDVAACVTAARLAFLVDSYIDWLKERPSILTEDGVHGVFEVVDITVSTVSKYT